MSSLPFAALAERGGFRCDPRFVGAPAAAPPPEDPLAQVWAEGYAAGVGDAQAAAQVSADSDAATRSKIELALARLDADLTEQLRQRLLVTVESLCEAAIAPFALDQPTLTARVAKAAAMLARADDQKVLRLHPDDLKLIGMQLPEGLEVHNDPALDRGSFRIETATGGVEDGPIQWRRALAEALAEC